MSRPARDRHPGDMAPPSVFVVDDQASFRRAARAVITAAGLDHAGEAQCAADAREALDGLLPAPDLVLIDVNLGAESGIDLTRELADARPELPIVLVSTMAAIDLPSDAATAGARAFVEKASLSPARLHELLAVPRDPNTPSVGVETPP